MILLPSGPVAAVGRSGRGSQHEQEEQQRRQKPYAGPKSRNGGHFDRWPALLYRYFWYSHIEFVSSARTTFGPREKLAKTETEKTIDRFYARTLCILKTKPDDNCARTNVFFSSNIFSLYSHRAQAINVGVERKPSTDWLATGLRRGGVELVGRVARDCHRHRMRRVHQCFSTSLYATSDVSICFFFFLHRPFIVVSPDKSPWVEGGGGIRWPSYHFLVLLDIF